MASIDVTGVSSEYVNRAELEQAGVPITGPRAELEGILREQGATPVERLLSLTDAGEAELPEPSAADPAPGPKGPTQRAVAEALVAIDAAALALSRGRAELTHNGGPDLDEAANELSGAPADVATAVRCVAYARDIRGGREPDDDAPEPPDPKREALEKRARAYEASGRLQQVAYGARPVTLEEERRAVEEHAERVRSAPINVAKAALRAVAEASTPAGQMAALDEASEAIDEACVDAFRQGAAEARQEASKAPPFVCSSADIAYLAVVGAMHEVHLATRDLTPPVAINPTTYTGEPHADKIEGLRDHARRLIASLDAWENAVRWAPDERSKEDVVRDVVGEARGGKAP